MKSLNKADKSIKREDMLKVVQRWIIQKWEVLRHE
tara:strand:- start:1144 stop:1248 length:105 start_codon:yes stop_codon:yes gene_type:complete